MLKRLQCQPNNSDYGDANIKSFHTIDEDDLAQGIAGLHKNSDLRQQQKFLHQQSLLRFLKNLQSKEGAKISTLARMSADELSSQDCVKLIDDISSEQDFASTYVEIEEKSTSGQFHALLQLSTVPVAVCFGTGNTQEDAKSAAAHSACEYIKLMMKGVFPITEEEDGTDEKKD